MELSVLSMPVFMTLLLSFYIAPSQSSNTTMLSKCREKERTAMLKFKATFYDKSCNHDTLLGADLRTWTVEGNNGDCCNWKGVECDEDSRNVIGLNLSSSCLSGPINSSSSSIFELVHLQRLDLSLNDLTGEIFSQRLKCTQLKSIDLSGNKFHGQIPTTISFYLKNLSEFFISSNNFSGEIDLDMFFKLGNLVGLDLSNNNLSLIRKPTIKPRRKLVSIALRSCNLTSFPKFLRDQDSLLYIDLSSNNIVGEVPKWFLDVSTKTLSYLNLSHNHLTGFARNVPTLKWKELTILDLSFNTMRGLIPSLLINTSPIYYRVSNNDFFGEMPTRMCALTTLEVLDLGNNNLSGEIPPCFTDLVSGGNLSLLSLQSNNFKGQIPGLGKDKCNLAMIDMSYNQLDGLIPRDIKNCKNLQFLNLRSNKINDVFPFWLGELPSLSVLVLDSNRFHGIIEKHNGEYHFPKLRIISLSRNTFIGSLPSEYFVGWNAMKDGVDEEGQLQYFSHSFSSTPRTVLDYYDNIAKPSHDSYYYSFRMTNKGIGMEYKKIQESLMLIDLSSNNFTGEIPESIGTLKGLRMLNLSNNMLTGSIPFNLNGLTNLESLDLSDNKLSGEIPQQLTDLTKLSVFDVSFNQLRGPIPSFRQFSTFENSSYQGNTGLCGLPLSRKCENTIEALSPSSLEKDMAGGTWIEIDWKIVCMGYASGLVIGMTLGMHRISRCKNMNLI